MTKSDAIRKFESAYRGDTRWLKAAPFGPLAQAVSDEHDARRALEGLKDPEGQLAEAYDELIKARQWSVSSAISLEAVINENRACLKKDIWKYKTRKSRYPWQGLEYINPRAQAMCKAEYDLERLEGTLEGYENRYNEKKEQYEHWGELMKNAETALISAKQRVTFFSDECRDLIARLPEEPVRREKKTPTVHTIPVTMGDGQAFLDYAAIVGVARNGARGMSVVAEEGVVNIPKPRLREITQSLEGVRVRVIGDSDRITFKWPSGHLSLLARPRIEASYEEALVRIV